MYYITSTLSNDCEFLYETVSSDKTNINVFNMMTQAIEKENE